MERKKCPYCGEEIAATAKKCRFCGEWLTNETASTIQSAALQPARQPDPQQMTQQPVSQPNPVPQPYYQPEPAQPEPAEEEQYEDDDLLTFYKAYFINPFIRRYADFSGYTSRKSFWLTYVATLILSVGLTGLTLLLASFGMGGMICGSIIAGLIGLALIIPGLALSVRRLRDAGKNPWLILLGLIPAVGPIILLIFFCLESKYEDTEEEGSWQMPDWIVTGVCALLLILGIIFSLKSISSLGSNDGYDLGTYDTEEVSYFDDDDPVEVVEEGVLPEASVRIPIDIESPNAFEGFEHEFHGKINNKYAVNMHLNLEDYSGSYYYLSSSGGNLDLEITYYDPNSRAIKVVETNANGEQTGLFDGYLSRDGRFFGTFTNYKGVDMPFKLEVQDAP